MSPDTCDVWWQRVPRQWRPADEALLDSAERTRLAQLRRADDRLRFCTATALLRRTVSATTGLPASQVAVERICRDCGRPHGKPRLPGLSLFVSISHSAELVGLAITAAGPVGLDVERADGRDFGRVMRRVLSVHEHAEDRFQFYRYWTRKESVVKATGDGIMVGLANVRVSGPLEPPRLLSYPGRRRLAATLHDTSPGPGFVAALTVLTARQVRVQEFTG